MWRRRIGAVGRWSLLTLTVALVTAWGVSARWDLELGTGGPRSVVLRYGRVALWSYSPEAASVFHPARLRVWRIEARNNDRLLFPGFERGEALIGKFLAVPIWSIVSVLTAANGVAWRKQIRATVKRDGPKARRKRGACVACGYDRSGLAATVVCPECGAAPAG